MNSTPRRVIRFILGALLPVPLFVGIYYASYFYLSYNGFDHETKTYLTEPSDIEITRMHLKTDLLVFLAFGYFMMGIPSLIYSLILEVYRKSPRFKLSSYTSLGAFIGGISGLIAVCFNFVLTDGAYDAALVVFISTTIGGLIPFMLYWIGKESIPRSIEQSI